VTLFDQRRKAMNQILGTIRNPGRIRALDSVLFRLGLWIVALGVCGCTPDAEEPRETDRPPVTAGYAAGPTTGLEEVDSGSMVLRRVEGGPDVDLFGASVTGDGRFLTFIDWQDTGDVMIREIATGEVERVTHDGVWEPYQTADDIKISRDGRQIAYVWYNEEAELWNYNEVRVVRRGDPEPRVLYASQDCGYPWLWGWSPDQEHFFFVGEMKSDTYELIKVSVADASVEVLKDLGSNIDPSHGAISWDGRYAAYEVLADGDPAETDIVSIDLETGATRPLVQHPGDDFVLGWAPRDEYLFFASDRSGGLGAWLQPLENGRIHGNPSMVKADLWRVEPIGFTEEGSFYFGIPLSSRRVFTASIDPETGAVLAPATPVSGDRIVHERSPTWSPDGRYLAYRPFGEGTSELIIMIQDVENGEAREVRPNLARARDFRWSPEEHSLSFAGVDVEGRVGFFRVNIETGEAEYQPQFAVDPSFGRFIDWGPDGEKLFYENRGAGITVVDVGTGELTVLYDEDTSYFPGLSPDGRYLAFGASDRGTPALMVMPTSGGTPQVLVRFEGSNSLRGVEMIRGIAWSADQRTILYALGGEPEGETGGLWRVPVEGGIPQRIDLFINGHPGPVSPLSLRLHPDGHRIAFDDNETHSEIWVIEDFLPTSGDEDRSP
jgi:Tol biopolymer transport system component